MEIHFNNIRNVIIEEFNKAEFNIYAAVAWVTDQNLIDELIKQLKRGIQVEIIVNDDERFIEQKHRFTQFLNYGGKLFTYDISTYLMHNKFCVIDLCTTITGSFNWTFGANKNQENIIVESKNIKVAHEFAKHFKLLKQNSKVYTNSKTANNPELAHKVKVSRYTFFDEDETIFLTLEEGSKEGILILNTIDHSIVPDYVQGFWKGNLTDDITNEKIDWLYEFICLDPNLMKYL